MAKDKAGAAPKGKAKKPKKGADTPPHPAAERIVRLQAHPRARRHIAAAKGWGGLIGFGLTLLLSLRAGTPAFDAGVRALVAGTALYLFAWAVAVAVWRQVAVAEVEAARRRIAETARKRLEEAGALPG